VYVVTQHNAMDSWNTVTEDATVKVVKTKRVAGLRQLDAASPMSFTALKSTCASILSGSVTGWWTARTSVMNMRGVQVSHLQCDARRCWALVAHVLSSDLFE